MSEKGKNGKPVLVVGAGPVGLTMACELARHGVPVRVIDKAPERTQFSKALGIHSRTVEILESMGVVEKFLAEGRNAYGTNVYYNGKRIVHIVFDELVCPFPFVLMVPQSETERLLEDHLSSFGVKVERGVELVALEQKEGEVNVTLRGASGSEETSTPWLSACDGSHSTIRHILDLSFDGAPYEELFGSADVKVECDLPDDEVHVLFNESGLMAMFPFGDSRWRLVFDVDADSVDEKNPQLEEFRKNIESRGPSGMKISDPRWLAWFRIHRRSVNEYRHGRIFLSGDAAHIHSPVGGQGMNTGIQDAYNLAWKLALVHAGAADETLLDSYHSERHPVGQAVLHGTDLATKVATIRNPIAQQVRNKLIGYLTSLEVIQARIMRQGSMLAVNYRESPIVGEHRDGLSQVKLFGAGGSESPDLTAWFDFGKGPSAGDRAPDATLLTPDGNDTVRLFEAVRGTRHSLLLFDGKPTEGGYKNFEELAKSIRDQYGQFINVHVIVAGSEKPKGLDWDGPVWLDPDLAAHQVYGAGSECLYLLRPDTYVGFRSQPADLGVLQGFLSRIFVR